MSKKGLLSLPYLVFTIIGVGFVSVVGNLMAPKVNWLILLITFFGVVLAQQVAHALHDLKHGGDRKTFSNKGLKIFIVFTSLVIVFFTIIILILVNIYMLIFIIVGVFCTLYTYFYHELVYAIAMPFVLLGSYYAQTTTITLPPVLIGLGMFFLFWGAISIYRFDHKTKKIEETLGSGFVRMCMMLPLLSFGLYFFVQDYQTIIAWILVMISIW